MPEPVIIPPASAAQWRDLAEAITKLGPVPCEGGVLPADAWFSTREDDVELARMTCRVCPVRSECLAFALAAREREGIWGGLTPAERAS